MQFKSLLSIALLAIGTVTAAPVVAPEPEWKGCVEKSGIWADWYDKRDARYVECYRKHNNPQWAGCPEKTGPWNDWYDKRDVRFVGCAKKHGVKVAWSDWYD